jgi:mono/diheme cytochrome c family protein
MTFDSVRLVVVVGLCGILAGCGAEVAPVDSGDSGAVVASPVGGGDDDDGISDPAGPTYDDVAPILDAHCTACHGTPLAGGAPFALDSYQAASSKADRIVARAIDGDPRPMPPSGLELSRKEENTLLDWVDAGMPR